MNLEGLDPQTFNNVIIEQLNTTEGTTKFAAAGGAYVKAKIREVSFSDKILPPQNVTRADLQRDTEHDTLVKILDIEHGSKAMILNFASEAKEKYIQGKRYAIPFFKIASEKFSKNEAELLAYDYAITKVIEENSVKDIQMMKDFKFIEHAEAAIAITGKKIVSPATALDRKELNSLNKMISGDKLIVGVDLMSTVDFDDWMIQPATEIGSPLASEVTKDGYVYDKILNKKLVVTNKTDLVLPGNIWAFTEPEYLGASFILNDVKFWIKKEADLLTFQSWMYMGVGFGNLRSMAKIELDVPSPIPAP